MDKNPKPEAFYCEKCGEELELNTKKLLAVFDTAKFSVVLYQDFHNSDFNWFALLYCSMPERTHS